MTRVPTHLVDVALALLPLLIAIVAFRKFVESLVSGDERC